MAMGQSTPKPQRGRPKASKATPTRAPESAAKARKQPAPATARRLDPSAAVSVASAEKILGVTLSVARERHSRLTERQRQVANLMARGKANRQIAEELGISPKTLDIHRADVMHKLEAETVAQVANLANLLRLTEIAG